MYGGAIGTGWPIGGGPLNTGCCMSLRSGKILSMSNIVSIFRVFGVCRENVNKIERNRHDFKHMIVS
jgi:hypothetical protein